MSADPDDEFIPSQPRRVETPHLDDLDYDRWVSADGDVDFYLSRATEGAPLLLCIQGSGCESVIRKTGDGRWRLGLHGFIHQSVSPDWRVLAVEKPGVSCFHQTEHPGASVGCPDEFLRQYRFDRWLEVLEKAVRSALTLERVAATPLAVVGESEGSLMAAHLAARVPEVSQVALLSPTTGPQIAEFADERWRNVDQGATDSDRHANVEALFEQFAEILAKPNSVKEWWRGHPFQRWATFGTQATLDGLLAANARVFLAYGTADSPAGADRLRAGLLAAGKDVTASRILHADHQLTVRVEGKERDIRDAVREVLSWLEKSVEVPR